MAPRRRRPAVRSELDALETRTAISVETPTVSTPRPPETLSPLSPISPWPPIPDLADDDLDLTPAGTPAAAPDVLPSAKEIYGSLAVLLTGIAYFLYLVWAFCPRAWLDYIGWTWYPSRDWALVVPCFLMLVVLLAYWSYAALTSLITPPFTSMDLITDKYANVPALRHGEDRYYWKFADPNTMPPAMDLPLDLVNRVLYPPRPRPQARRD